MNIKIIIHSRTGHTLLVAQQLCDKLLAAGHSAAIEQVTALKDSGRNAGSVVLTNSPSTAGCDLVIFGAPVHGFALSFAMQAYLKTLPSLEGTLVLGFVTMAFPHPAMGGYQAISQLSQLCRQKGAEFPAAETIQWMRFFSRKRLISKAVERMATFAETHKNQPA